MTSSKLLDEIGGRIGLVAGIVVLMWSVELVNLILGYRLNSLGILPRSVSGLPGVVLAPFLHGSIAHLMANTIPLAILGLLVLVKGETSFIRVTAFVVVVGGLAVWLVGRPALHIGASGLIFGYFGYLIATGWFERSVGSMLIALVTVALYGGVLIGLLPVFPGVSWEMHLFGLAAGVLAARLV